MPQESHKNHFKMLLVQETPLTLASGNVSVK